MTLGMVLEGSQLNVSLMGTGTDVQAAGYAHLEGSAVAVVSKAAAAQCLRVRAVHAEVGTLHRVSW